jgi:hypothetical protein
LREIILSPAICVDQGLVAITTLVDQTSRAQPLAGLFSKVQLTPPGAVSLYASNNGQYCFNYSCYENIDDFSKMKGAYAKYFGKAPPARATVAVSRFPRDVLIEISATGAK